MNKKEKKGWSPNPYVLIVLIVKFLGWAAKVNKRVATDGRERKRFWEELIYGFYVIFHPFDGFYDLKHEKRGSVRASLVFIALTILSFFYQGIGHGVKSLILSAYPAFSR